MKLSKLSRHVLSFISNSRTGLALQRAQKGFTSQRFCHTCAAELYVSQSGWLLSLMDRCIMGNVFGPDHIDLGMLV